MARLMRLDRLSGRPVLGVVAFAALLALGLTGYVWLALCGACYVALLLLIAADRRKIALLAQQNEALTQSVDLLELSEHLAGVGRWRYDARKDSHHWSPDMCAILGLEPTTRPKPDLIAAVLGEGMDALSTTFTRHRSDEDPFLVEFEITQPDGEYRLLRARARNQFDGSGEVTQVLMAVRDVTEDYQQARRLRDEQQRALESAKRAEQLANTDPLTGLANRRFAMNQIDRSIVSARRQGTPMSLIVFDLDHFKKINDTFGHVAGDAVLIRVAKLARLLIPETEVVARFGGEEFVCMLTDADSKVAHEYAERLRWSIESGSATEGVPGCTASVGHATLGPGESSLTLFARADAALYEAKEAGRNQVRMARDNPSVANKLDTEQQAYVGRGF
ncbi:MAG: sensor domain-containing diguanylate cyclase [Sphingomonadaceae bacterium]